MTEATHEGADLQSAANAISNLFDAGSNKKKQPSSETPKAKESESTAVDSGDVKPQNDAKQVDINQSDAESPEDSGDDADTNEYQLPSHIDELAEHMGITPDDLFNLKIKTKVDGQESEVSLAELRKSYQLEKHLNNKSMQFAEQQKAHQAQMAAQQQQMQQQMQELGAYSKYLENELTREYSGINWAELRVIDPAEFAAKRQEYSDKLNQIQNFGQAVNHHIQQEELKNQEAFKQQVSQTIEREYKVLLSKVPEWSDQNKAAAEKTKIRSYLKNHGYDDQDLNSVIDHRAIIVARKAMRYDELMQSKPDVTKKVQTLPKFIKQNGVMSKGDIKAENQKAKFKQLKKSGSLKDAASLLLDRM